LNVLKYKRILKEWSQEELAFQAGLHQGDISKFESDRLQPYPVQAKRLAEVLDVHQDDLLKEA